MVHQRLRYRVTRGLYTIYILDPGMQEQMDVVHVKKLMGHYSLGTTMKYLHPKTPGATDAVNRRNAARGLHIVPAELRQDYDKTSDIAISVAV
jgi:hypothetical protein